MLYLDLPRRGLPRVRMDFGNGWSVLIIGLPSLTLFRRSARHASVAAAPTGRWNSPLSQVLAWQADADGVAQLVDSVRTRPPVEEAA